MITVKKCISDIKRADIYTLVCKINYISSSDNFFVERINSGLAERIFAYFTSQKLAFEGVMGNISAVLTPTVTYLDDKAVSIKYDLTVMSQNTLIFHKRFCVNLLYNLELVLLPRFLKSNKVRGEFYLTESENGVICTPVVRSMPGGTVVNRRREIDLYCDGKTYETELIIPKYLTKRREKARRKSK